MFLFSFDDDSRQCWVCLASDDDDDDDEEDDKKPDTEWIHPCRCNGSGKLNFWIFLKTNFKYYTAKWVHQNCLQQWIDEKQKYNSSLNVSCTQCNTEYLIVFPQHGNIQIDKLNWYKLLINFTWIKKKT